jgi:hypothetical protein
MAQPRPIWDSRGWVKLGDTLVNGHGRLDVDTIQVGAYEGRFSRLTIVVEDGDMELVDMTIKFGDGSEMTPAVGHFFREGQRTRVIDLPSYERIIRNITFRYRNLSGVGHARVGVWGWRVGDTVAPVVYTAPQWDQRGWVLLGERQVSGHGRLDHDRIEVGRQSGRFNRLTLVVLDADLEMVDFEVKFGPGPGWHPAVTHFFREGQRTRVIDFPQNAWGSDERSIRNIDFAYRNIPGEGHARVQVWGWRAESAPIPVAPVFDSRDWTMLGETVVNGHGREDHDRIRVGRGMGKFSRLTIVVTDSDLEMLDMSVQFRHGDPYHPAVKHFFREGQRARVVEFPPSEYGNEERTIEWIDFAYRNIPGEGHARVQVWAR